jgi:hypothetical protein
MSSHTTVQRRLITPSVWGKKNVFAAPQPPEEHVCIHCSHKGMNTESTIAGLMYRCPACKKLQF